MFENYITNDTRITKIIKREESGEQTESYPHYLSINYVSSFFIYGCNLFFVTLKFIVNNLYCSDCEELRKHNRRKEYRFILQFYSSVNKVEQRQILDHMSGKKLIKIEFKK